MTQEKNMDNGQGFLNAPNIKYWADGMYFKWRAAQYRVVHAFEDGQSAVAVVVAHDKQDDVPYPKYQAFGRYDDRGSSTLDLSSIWLGREYREKTNGKGHVIVYSVSDHVGFREVRDGFSACWTRGCFLRCYEPVPLAKPAEQPKTCGECRKHNAIGCPYEYCHPLDDVEACSYFIPKPARSAVADEIEQELRAMVPWTPEIGKECIWAQPFYDDCVVRVIGYDDKYLNWVCRATGCGYIGISLEQLKPLPPEPPVKQRWSETEIDDIIDELHEAVQFYDVAGCRANNTVLAECRAALKIAQAREGVRS